MLFNGRLAIFYEICIIFAVVSDTCYFFILLTRYTVSYRWHTWNVIVGEKFKWPRGKLNISIFPHSSWVAKTSGSRNEKPHVQVIFSITVVRHPSVIRVSDRLFNISCSTPKRISTYYFHLLEYRSGLEPQLISLISFSRSGNFQSPGLIACRLTLTTIYGSIFFQLYSFAL